MPSVSMPCDYRILQSPTKEQVKLVLWDTVERSQFREYVQDILGGTEYDRVVF